MLDSLFKSTTRLALPIVILLMMTLACDAWIDVIVKVVDENHDAIGDAHVIVQQGKSRVVERETDSTGLLHVHENVCPMPGCSSDYSVIVSKAGYETVTRHFDRTKNYNGSDGFLVVELKKQ